MKGKAIMLRMAALLGLLLYGGDAMAAAAAVPAVPAVRPPPLPVACAADIQKYCKSVQPGGGRLIVCLQPQKAKLAPTCRTSLDAVVAFRQRRRMQSHPATQQPTTPPKPADTKPHS